MNTINTRKVATGLMAGAASLALLAGASFAESGSKAGQASGTQTQTQGSMGTTGTTGQSGTTGQTGSTMGQSGTTGQTGSTTGTAGAASTQSAGMLDEDKVKSMLEKKGYSEVENVERDGLAWKAEAKRDDETVELRIERMMQSADNLDEDRVKTLLETVGFSDVDDVQEEDDLWTAAAKRDGDDVKVRVNSEEQVVVSEKTSG